MSIMVKVHGRIEKNNTKLLFGTISNKVSAPLNGVWNADSHISCPLLILGFILINSYQRFFILQVRKLRLVQ